MTDMADSASVSLTEGLATMDLIGNIRVKAVLEAVRNVMFERCKDLGPQEYWRVLQELEKEIQVARDQLREANSEAEFR